MLSEAGCQELPPPIASSRTTQLPHIPTHETVSSLSLFFYLILSFPRLNIYFLFSLLCHHICLSKFHCRSLICLSICLCICLCICAYLLFGITQTGSPSDFENFDFQQQVGWGTRIGITLLLIYTVLVSMASTNSQIKLLK